LSFWGFFYFFSSPELSFSFVWRGLKKPGQHSGTPCAQARPISGVGLAVAVLAMIAIPFSDFNSRLLAAIAIPNFVKGRAMAQEKCSEVNARSRPDSTFSSWSFREREVSQSSFIASFPMAGALS